MKFKLNKLGLVAGVFAAAFALQSCTDLDPVFYSETDSEDFERSEAAMNSKLGEAYVHLQREYGYVYREGYWSIQENTTDECVVPTRYLGDWLDGNNFWILHNHRFTSKIREIAANGSTASAAWAFPMNGIAKINNTIDWMRRFNLIESNPETYAEMVVFRCWYHMLLLDVFGSAPYVSNLEQGGYKPVQCTREALCDSIMTDLNTYVPQLSKEKVYCRINRYVGDMIMAKMYLNAEAWGVLGKSKVMPASATECYNKAVEYCNEIIKQGGYSLEPDYFTNFKVDNENSIETLWAVYYDALFSKGMQFHMMTLHYASKESYGLKNQPWNGYCTTHKVIGLYGEGDNRINSWDRGEQKKANGEKIFVAVPVDQATYNKMPEYVRKPVNWPETMPQEIADGGTVTYQFPAYFTDTITTLTNDDKFKVYNIFEGARFKKFQYQEGVGDHMSNDFPIYRLADVYLMKAEALMRANGGTATDEAVDAVNIVRSRAGATSLGAGELTLDELCNERVRELCWEGHRRTDLIRFGRFTGVNSVPNDADPANLWILRTSVDQPYDTEGYVPEQTPDFKKVCPLPDFAVEAGYIQNPGYEE